MEIDYYNQGFTNAHHRDTERTENAQRQKKQKLKVGLTRMLFLGWNYRYDDYNQ